MTKFTIAAVFSLAAVAAAPAFANGKSEAVGGLVSAVTTPGAAGAAAPTVSGKNAEGKGLSGWGNVSGVSGKK